VHEQVITDQQSPPLLFRLANTNEFWSAAAGFSCWRSPVKPTSCRRST